MDNPYTAGAGDPPGFMAGRSAETDYFALALSKLTVGRSAKGLIISGMRGVGKTVLLNSFEEAALISEPRWFTAQVEVSRNTRLADIMSRVCRKLLLDMSRSERMKERAMNALRVLKAFKASSGGVDVSFDVDALNGSADSGYLADDLRDLLIEVGEVAKRGNVGALLLFDEVHKLARDDYEALILALHRVKQKKLPLTFVGAGLPLLPTLTGEAETYASRLFRYPTIGALSEEDAAEALVHPAAEEGVSYGPGALERIFEVTQGYPYFLQEYGEHVWDRSREPVISLAEVDAALGDVMSYLDKNFFKVHIGDLRGGKRNYASALADLGNGPQASSEVARKLHRTTSDLSVTRDRLMKDDLIYSPQISYVDFTVPHCANYVRRHYPFQ